MSAAADFPNAWATAEKGRHVDSGEIRSALTELDALRAELSALKARRCDGCAHSDGHDPDDPESWGDCEVAFSTPDYPMGHGTISVRASHSCAAWTEKP